MVLSVTLITSPVTGFNPVAILVKSLAAETTGIKSIAASKNTKPFFIKDSPTESSPSENAISAIVIEISAESTSPSWGPGPES